MLHCWKGKHTVTNLSTATATTCIAILHKNVLKPPERAHEGFLFIPPVLSGSCEWVAGIGDLLKV